MYESKEIKRSVLGAAVLFALGAGAAHGTTDTLGNNFTMLSAALGLQGGTNDVRFTWDHTLRTSVVTDGSNNATLVSPTKFAGFLWTAHNINIYASGTYVFDTTCPPGNPSCGTGTGTQLYTLTVPPGYVGAHMLFDWNTSHNIDVIELWKLSDSWSNTPAGNTDPFCAAPLTNGGCATNPNPNGNTRDTVFSLLSVDTNQDADTAHGTKMIDGPFVGSSANFDVIFTLDTMPDAFTFVDQTGVPTSSMITSNTITVSKASLGAISGVFAISVVGGEYSIDGGAFTSTAGLVATGHTVQVHHTSASTSATATDTTLTIGGVSDTFTSTTIDTTPDAFTFVDQTGVALSSTITSNTITVTGVTAATPISISVSGDPTSRYSVNGGACTNTSGTVVLNDTVSVCQTSAATNNTATDTTLTIGGVSDTFTSVTVAGGGPDTTPDIFTLNPQAGVALSSPITSNTITVTGINAAAAISVSGDPTSRYSVNGGACNNTSGTVVLNDTVSVCHTSAGTDNTSISTTLTIGGVSSTFTSTTGDTTPDLFTFVDQAGVALSSPITSNTITVTGINAAAAISVSGDPTSRYSVNGGACNNTSGTVVLNDTVSVCHTSASNNNTATNTTLTIGGVIDTFTSTTVAATATILTTADAPSKATGCSISSVPVSATERGDWWLVAGFLAWLGALRIRFKRKTQL